jgi:hypothetical protein
MATHTPGAIRAAEAITGGKYEEPGDGPLPMYPTSWGKKTVYGIADLIDRETGGPELLAALRGMLSWARRIKELNWGPEIARACSVLAKAKRGEK